MVLKIFSFRFWSAVKCHSKCLSFHCNAKGIPNSLQFPIETLVTEYSIHFISVKYIKWREFRNNTAEEKRGRKNETKRSNMRIFTSQ